MDRHPFQKVHSSEIQVFVGPHSVGAADAAERVPYRRFSRGKLESV